MHVNFTKKITDAVCIIDINSASQALTLDNISPSTFFAAGNTAAPTKFSVTLTNSPERVTSESVKFDRWVNPNLLSVNTDSAATGVGIAIYESDSATQIPLLASLVTEVIDSTAATNTLSFIASYMATAAKVTAGSENAVTDFTIIYD